MNKKDSLKVLVIVALIAILAGVSYAYWQITRTQNDKNIVTTGCFEIESDIGTEDELDPIRLLKTYPIVDSEGKQLTPFTFTLRNTCDTYAGYQINLESLNTTTLNLDYLKVVMDSETPKVLSAYDVVEKTLNDATTSHKLLTGGLKAGSSQTFNLRLWLDQDTPLESGQNKTYEGKIVIIASPEEDKTATTKILSLVEGSDSTSTDVIVKDAPDSSCTNTLAYDGTVDNNLRYVGANPCNYACFNDECPTVSDVYQAYLDGILITNRFGTFDSETACTSQLTENRNIKNELGIDGELTCELDSTTNKYAVVGHGFIKNYGNFVSYDACMANMSSWGLTYQANTTPPSTITCQKNGKMLNGGWRVIGLMNNIDDGTGKKEQRVKLIRNDSLGNYSWDISETSINNGFGINQWGPSGEYPGADLMQELNGDYLNYNLTSNPMWYGYQSGYTETGYSNNYGKNTEFDKMKALSASAQSLIGDAVWYTGVYNDTSVENSNVITSVAYQNERSNNPNATNNGKYCSSENNNICNDTVTRTTSWTGKVALINVSDFGYAVGGLSRSTCLTTNLSSYSSNNCYANDWLKYESGGQWSLSPDADTTYAILVGSVVDDGRVSGSGTTIRIAVRPVVYLLSSTKITEGNGSAESPYIFEK